MTHAIPASAVRFNDNNYRFTYGHSPRGRGWWWFSVEGHQNDPITANVRENPFWFIAGPNEQGFTPTYSEAKMQAAKWAAPQGHRFLVVLT